MPPFLLFVTYELAESRDIFNNQGRLVEQIDPFGNSITFTYDNGRLIQAGQGNRYLTYSYDETSGRLLTVSDNISRTVTLIYDENGDLSGVVNPLTLTTTHAYSGTTHLLTKVTDASGRVIEETAYDNEGWAYRQWDGEGNLLVEIDYSLANQRVVIENGVIMTHTYDLRGTLVDVSYGCTADAPGCGAGSDVAYDYHFKARQTVDANGHATNLNWSANGSNLEGVTDALDNHTSLTYDEFNNLVQVVNARGLTTTYSYDDPNLPTFRTRVTDSLEQTTIYTPTAEGLLAAEEDPHGRITTYAYNEFGQTTQVVRAAGTAQAITTTYGYDPVGRLITTTQSSPSESHTTLNVYDAGDRLMATISNWTGSDPAAWAQDCSFAPGPRDENVCTMYGYDDAGRVISTTNALGQINLTFYDDAGRVVTSVVNYDGATPAAALCADFNDPDPEYNLCSLTGYDEFGRVVTTTDSLGRLSVTEYDPLGRVSRAIANYDDGLFDPQEPDRDIETRFGYDAVGNTIIVTDTLGFMTRTFYDPLNRVKGTIANWSGGIDDINDLPNCLALPRERDYDVCTVYEYDEVGNTIIVTDTLGQMTRTFYDELNRVAATVANWDGVSLSPCLPLSLSPGANVCTLYGYDPAGNQITTTNALDQTNLTVYDAANRPFITVQNWDGTPIESENDCSFPPQQSDVNLCSVTYFDALGRRSAVKDPLGNLTEFSYDGLGRAVATTRYLDQLPITNYLSFDALGNRLFQTDAEENTTTFLYDSLNRLVVTLSAEGVAITQTYDAAGRLLATTDNLAQTTTYQYDGLDRLVSVTDAENNTTEYIYDALGNQTAMIDAEGVRTTYLYDDLNRLVGVVENDTGGGQTSDSNVLTQYRYNALGNRTVITNALNYTATLTTYDALNRPVIVEDALGNQTEYAYNALGYRTVMTDANSAVTTYQYDGLNRVAAVSYLADGETVSYSYDAAGNRMAMTDTLGVTSYTYDSLNRPIIITDPFTGTVGYGYDLVGNRTRLIYPDSREVVYSYDGDYRLIQVEDWDEDITSYEYDPAGRLITTTLPNGVVTVNGYDAANRLASLTHWDAAAENLLAEFVYELDGLGNRIVATETLRVPGPLQPLADFTLSTPELEGDQTSPSLAYNTVQDEYLVVWYDGDNRAIMAQRATDTKPTGSAVTIENGFRPQVAYSSSDDVYLVVWDDGEDIWAAQVAVSGTTGLDVGTPFQVYDAPSTTPAGYPAIAYSAANETFLVAWQREANPTVDPLTYLIQARLVPVGSSMGGVTTVASGEEPLTTPATAADSEGGYLVLWHNSDDGYIYGRMLDNIGAVSGSAFPIDDSGSLAQTHPRAAWSDDAEAYLVVWQEGADAVQGRRVDAEGAIIGQTILFDKIADAAYRPVVAAAPGGWLVAWVEFDAAGIGGNFMIAAQEINQDGQPLGEQFIASSGYGPVGEAALAGSAERDHYLLAWNGKGIFGVTPFRIYSSALERSQMLQTTTIQYDYDPLYRLTEAVYTGAITATYSYLYDAVGNMTAYTETVGTETSNVTRTFDPANRLQTALDSEQGTSSYYFDNSGNLVEILPPGADGQNPAGRLRYGYDQRNLLITSTLYISGTGEMLQAAFVYDGVGNRVQQVDHTSGQPVTTTYTSDIVGLAQVLIADDGATQTHNLLGTSLHYQVTVSETRFLLADGLGSVRLEMVGSVVDSAATYEPYGKLLARSGPSGTVYGFTGEQHDAATGLVYLRARYYSPSLKIFLSMDPWAGNPHRPMSYNKYLYVYANPINLTDPTGLDAWWCETPGCQAQHYGIDFDARDLTLWLYNEMMTNINDPRLRFVRTMNHFGNQSLRVGIRFNPLGCFPDGTIVGLNPGAASAAAYYTLAAVQFYNLVANEKPWDFKHMIQYRLGRGVTLCSTAGCVREIEYSVPGNIHYGYVGREAGYNAFMINLGAGVAEIIDPAHRQPDAPPYGGKFGWVMSPAGVSLNIGDDVKDHRAVQFGRYLYDTYGRGMTLGQFKAALNRFMSGTEFARHPANQQPVDPNIATDWPYRPGYFNPSPK